MNAALKIGNLFGTSLNLHISWLWILPLIAFTLVWYGVSEWLGAITTTLLIFASVLSATLAQLWAAQRVGLQWQRMTLFLLGSVVERAKQSNPQQELRVAGAGSITYLLLGLIAMLLANSARIELQTVAIFNTIILLFSLLLRLSPKHDNVLHATLAAFFDQPLPQNIVNIIFSFALPSFVISGIFMLAIGWVAFACWAAVAVMLSQITTTAEQYGEYQEDIIQSTPSVQIKIIYRIRSSSRTKSTRSKKFEDNNKGY